MILFGDRPMERKAHFEDRAGPHIEALEEMGTMNPQGYNAINEYLDEKQNQIWTDYKEPFFYIQHRKCGYCEAKITST